MKVYNGIIYSAIAIVLAAVMSFALTSCKTLENKEEESQKTSYSIEESNTEESQSETNTNDEPSYTVKEVYSSRDGLKIYGKLFVPNNKDDKKPAVILAHSANLNSDSMNLYAIGFAERGYIAYAIDFCGASSKSRSDGRNDDMTIFSEIEDLKAALKTISSMDNVDKESIYLFGTSQGGLVSALTAEECEDNIKGLILLYPAFNIPELVKMASGWGGVSGVFEGGYSKKFSDTLKDYDVYEHIGNFDNKVLIIHGSADFIVNKSYSLKAQERYSDCTLKILNGAGHGFNKENYSMGGNFDDEVWKSIDEYLTDS